MGFKTLFGNIAKIGSELWNTRSTNWIFENGQFSHILNGGQTGAGVKVTEHSALMSSAVWAATNLISGTIGYLPAGVFEKLDVGKKTRQDHIIYQLLRTRPSPNTTPIIYKSRIISNMLLWGNGYGIITRNGVGTPIRIDGVHASRVQPFLDENGRLWYRIGVSFNKDSITQNIVSADDMIHLKNFGTDELEGKSCLHYAREAIGGSLATQAYGNSFFANGGRAKHAIILLGNPGKEVIEELSNSWNSKDKNGTAVLTGGATIQQLDIPPNDAQFLETRNFQVQDVARYFYQIPPPMIGELSDATYDNITAQISSFQKFTLTPVVKQFEEEHTYKLFRRLDEGNLFVELNMDAILRGDIEARWKSYAIALEKGAMNRDEVRSLENMNPFKGGEVYTVQANMTNIEDLIRPNNLSDN